jgi:hypothetical protein
MIRIDCDTARENIDAHAIGALDADETPALEAHLAGCPECARLAEEARAGAGALALSVPLVPANSALKARVMASAAVLTPPAPRRLRPNVRWWPLAAAALFVVSAGAVTWGAITQRQVNDLRGQTASTRADATRVAGQLAAQQQQQQALASWQDGMLLISTQADAERSDLNGTALAPSARGTYMWSAKEEMGALLATGLPQLPEGRTYRFWFVYDTRWEDAGVATLDASGHAQLIVRRDEAGEGNEGKLLGFALTVEPSGTGGVRTGAMVLQSSTLN